jgi:hypothetical protein
VAWNQVELVGNDLDEQQRERLFAEIRWAWGYCALGSSRGRWGSLWRGALRPWTECSSAPPLPQAGAGLAGSVETGPLSSLEPLGAPTRPQGAQAADSQEHHVLPRLVVRQPQRHHKLHHRGGGCWAVAESSGRLQALQPPCAALQRPAWPPPLERPARPHNLAHRWGRRPPAAEEEKQQHREPILPPPSHSSPDKRHPPTHPPTRPRLSTSRAAPSGSTARSTAPSARPPSSAGPTRSWRAWSTCTPTTHPSSTGEQRRRAAVLVPLLPLARGLVGPRLAPAARIGAC